MPDPVLQTVSASQVPGLFNKSQYFTRFMLYQHFTGGFELQGPDHNRADWGLRLQQTILDYVAEELHLDIIGNTGDLYMRHPDGIIGCTPDGYCWSPEKGLGFIEVKNVDWLIHAQTWTSARAPEAIELQHQTQLMVPCANLEEQFTDDRSISDLFTEYGFDEHTGASLVGFLQKYGGRKPTWGVIACLIGGNDVKLYHREPREKIQKRIRNEAKAFLKEVAEKTPPPVAGLEVEMPALTALYPMADEDIILGESDFEDDQKGWNEIVDIVRQYAYWRDARYAADKEEKKFKLLLLEQMGLAGVLRIPGYRIGITKSPTKANIAKLPPEIHAGLGQIEGKMISVGSHDDADVLRLSQEWEHVVRKAGITTRINVSRYPEEVDAADRIPFPIIDG